MKRYAKNMSLGLFATAMVASILLASNAFADITPTCTTTVQMGYNRCADDNSGTWIDPYQDMDDGRFYLRVKAKNTGSSPLIYNIRYRKTQSSAWIPKNLSVSPGNTNYDEWIYSDTTNQWDVADSDCGHSESCWE